MGLRLKFNIVLTLVFAAAETFNSLRKKYPDFTYKEATLNP